MPLLEATGSVTSERFNLTIKNNEGGSLFNYTLFRFLVICHLVTMHVVIPVPSSINHVYTFAYDCTFSLDERDWNRHKLEIYVGVALGSETYRLQRFGCAMHVVT